MNHIPRIDLYLSGPRWQGALSVEMHVLCSTTGSASCQSPQLLLVSASRVVAVLLVTVQYTLYLVLVLVSTAYGHRYARIVDLPVASCLLSTVSAVRQKFPEQVP